MEKINDFDLRLDSSDNEYFDEIMYNSTNQKKGMILRALVVVFFVGSSFSLSSVDTISDYKFKKENPSITRSSLELYSKLSEYDSQTIKNYIKSKKSFIDNIISFESLEDGWDGYGALPLGEKCAKKAIELLNILCETDELNILSKISDIYPNPNGTVTFECESKLSEIVSLEVGEETFSYFVDFKSKETEFYNKQNFTPENIQLLRKYISEV